MAEEKKTTKIKKKRWYQIVAPDSFKRAVLGDTYLADPKQLNGKTLSVNLMSLIGDVKKQNIRIKFRVTKVDDNKGMTEFVGYSMVPSSIKRIVRRDKEKADFLILGTTSDGKKIKINIILVTRSKTKGSVLTSLKKSANSLTKEILAKTNLATLVNDIISFKLSRVLRDRLSKTYPLKILVIRKLAICSNQATEVLPSPKEAKESPAEKTE